MTLTCPVCHSRNSVESALLTEAGQAYTRLLLSQPDWLRYSLARYVLLFAPAGREMAYDRRLRLVEETLALDPDARRLAVALAETVEAIMAKRREGDVRPLTKHNYLKRVLESVTASPLPVPADSGSGSEHAPKGKRRLAIEILAAWAGDDWLRVEISHGLQALVSLPSLAPPGADSVELTAGVFEAMIRPRCNIFEVDSGRVERAFNELLKEPLKEWPEPAAIIARLPRRPDREKVAHQVSDEDRRKGKDFFSKIQGGI